MTVPSIAAAHPGHEHVGISESHHLSGAGMLIAALLAGGAAYAIYRIIKNRSND